MIGQAVILAARPKGHVSTSDFDVVMTTVPALQPGHVLVRNTWLSIDPSVRLRLGDASPRGYLPAFEAGQILEGLCVGEIVESRAAGFAPGDTVMHAHGYREYAVVDADSGGLAGAGRLTRVNPSEHHPKDYLGLLGNTGMAAWAGLVLVAQLREGDVVWVSAAAGAVGSIAARLARLRGHTVIGSAGSPEKVARLRDEFHLSAAFDYHTGDLTDTLEAIAPEGIDVYFDNVGGDHLEAALNVLRPGGRVAMCGAIADYDRDSPAAGPSNLFQVVSKSLTLRGFRSGEFTHRFGEMRDELGARLAAGDLTLDETVYTGIESAPAALVDLLNGRSLGKTLCRLTGAPDAGHPSPRRDQHARATVR
ncbi:NADP-dependent oxidoreductase [Gordonia McavH-238-E]|uniref:NADP-dependent oxidoreductase n=1 Tax=Gordonia sp. McavH-238-E TaxID=2917736 RepID=UPI001EF65E92|nr:NADP-dependent oxidoreductase [Gordonia sp. McavH-238-E]MCG7633267.1 NADP-dependent oxidoreductase [Gordonia sp. McavH-238-E]